MGVQTWRLKGIPKKDLRSRIANKRAKELWHFGPKEKETKKNTEPVEIIIQRMRFS
jgi:DNA-directed RNA polymerase subunit K/omega